jgi:hypothetical protein
MKLEKILGPKRCNLFKVTSGENAWEKRGAAASISVTKIHFAPVNYDRHGDGVKESALGAVVPVGMSVKNAALPGNPSPAYSQFNPDAARLQIIKRVEPLLRNGIAFLDKTANNVSCTVITSMTRVSHVHGRDHGTVWIQQNDNVTNTLHKRVNQHQDMSANMPVAFAFWSQWSTLVGLLRAT